MKKKKQPDLIIDPEFASQIPPLDAEEYEMLEKSIVEDKAVINPIVTWNGIIVDGHHRYRIICDHPEINISYQVYEKKFEDRNAAQAWMCNNQLGRRNLTPEQKKYLIGKRYSVEKTPHGGDRKSDEAKSSGQFDHLIFNKTRERIAKETHTSDGYVKRAEKYAQGVDLAEETVPGTRMEILSRKIKPSDKDMNELLKTEDPEARKELILKFHEEREPARNKPEEELTDEPDNTPVTDVSLSEIKKTTDAFEHSDGKATEDDVIYELNDALNSLMFRWQFCVEQNSEAAKGPSYRRRRNELIKTGIDFLHNFKSSRKKGEKT